MRAPRPTLICASTRDKTFPIEGTWPLFREAKRFYTRLRHSERVDLTEPDAPHGFTLQTREATVQWMRRWLLGIDDVVREIDELPAPMDDKLLGKLSDGDWTEQELQCTTEGQVLLTPGEKSVFRLNEEIERASRASIHRMGMRSLLPGATNYPKCDRRICLDYRTRTEGSTASGSL